MINEALQWATLAILSAYIAKTYRTAINAGSMAQSTHEHLLMKLSSLERTYGYILELVKQVIRTKP
jgi:hypothetical protein